MQHNARKWLGSFTVQTGEKMLLQQPAVKKDTKHVIWGWDGPLPLLVHEFICFNKLNNINSQLFIKILASEL